MDTLRETSIILTDKLGYITLKVLGCTVLRRSVHGASGAALLRQQGPSRDSSTADEKSTWPCFSTQSEHVFVSCVLASSTDALTIR